MKVIDRRRFDMDGNARSEQEHAPVPAVEPEEPEPPVAPSPEPAEAAPPSEDEEFARLREELDTARRRVDELARAYQALERDREDFKNRLSRERERLIDVEKGQVAQALLEAIDELDMALAASAADDSPLAKGVRLIREALLKKVQASGIERLNLTGLPYDPGMAEASDMEVTADPDEDQKVTAELRAGYKLKDRVIRPARVRIARYVKPADA
ncbi:MAG: nucleotide exchange factor GrpE [Myxococcaceae bacterium]